MANAPGAPLRRGGYLLCARVDEDCADEAIRILDESDSVDLEERENSWRSEGSRGALEQRALRGKRQEPLLIPS